MAEMTGHWVLWIVARLVFAGIVIAVMIYCSALGLFNYTPPEDPWTKK